MAPRAPHTALHRTIVTPHLSARHLAGKNLVYCATFAMAYRALEERWGRPVNLSPPWSAAAQMRQLPASGAVDEASSLIAAGLGRDGVVDRIQREGRRKFGVSFSPSVPGVSGEDALIYACLRKSLAFAAPLLPAPYGLRFGRPEVRAFGVWREGPRDLWEARARQIAVHRHRPGRGDFEGPEMVLELFVEPAGDRLLLARIPPRRTLAETVKEALDVAGGAGEAPIEEDETVMIPVVDLSVSRAYDEIQGRPLAEGESVKLGVARQDIELVLDERGAVLASEAALGVASSAPPRSFYFTRPFLISLSRRDQEIPYFAMWIEDVEVLAAS